MTVVIYSKEQYLPVAENPSCLHATLASLVSHPSSHTVPHVLFIQISTRPSSKVFPSTSLIAPSVHPMMIFKHNKQKTTESLS